MADPHVISTETWHALTSCIATTLHDVNLSTARNRIESHVHSSSVHECVLLYGNGCDNDDIDVDVDQDPPCWKLDSLLESQLFGRWLE